MKHFSNFSPYRTHRKHDIFVHRQKTSNYGDGSLRALDHTHGTPYHKNIKSTAPIIFKDFIKNWFGPKCKCKL